MKRYLSIFKVVEMLLLTAVFLAVLVSAEGQTAVRPPFGSGSQGNPYHITSLENLYWIGVSNAVVPDPDYDTRRAAYYIQTHNINASATSEWFDGQGWIPLGGSEWATAFRGGYNGNGFVIDSLFINRPEVHYIGLFGQLFHADAENIELTNVNITGRSSVGGLTGRATGADIRNCSVTGSVTGTGDMVGGLVGYMSRFTFQNNHNRSSVTGQDRVGGLIGHLADRLTIENCHNDGEVSGITRVGGVVGYALGNPSIINCVNTGAVTAEERTAGGLAGYANELIMRFCRNTGDVSGGNSVGGLVASAGVRSVESSRNEGDISGIDNVGGLFGTVFPINVVIIENCFNMGDITGQGVNVGGLFGSGSISIRMSHCTGNVTGYSNVGGLVGNYRIRGTIWSSYKAGSVNGEGYGIGGLIGNFQDETSIWNSYYNYEQMLINGEQAITAGALDDEMYTAWHEDSFYLNIINYLELYQGSYQINSLNDFKKLLAFGQFEDYSYRLNSNIDLRNHPGLYIPYLKGDFDGNGYMISNLTINLPFGSKTGLFGHVYNGAINKLGAVNVDITGKEAVGGLVGYARQATIQNSYTTGSVAGNMSVGGLVGMMSIVSAINDCYSMTGVEADSLMGGLVGIADNSTIMNCFSAGRVIGEEIYAGGLVGFNLNSTISSSYWDINTSRMRQSDGGEGKFTRDMTYPYTEGTYERWDFDNIWSADVSGLINQGYPFLRWHKAVYPNIAVNPSPANDTTDVSTELLSLSWQYSADSPFADPVGFRLYFGTCPDSLERHGSFVFYTPGVRNYSLSREHAPHLEHDTDYYWQVVPTADRDNPEYDAVRCPVWSFRTVEPVNVDRTVDFPLYTRLQRNYPNPFNPETTISFSLAERGKVLLEVFNIRGQKVATLIQGELSEGKHQVIWNGRNDNDRQTGSGVYLYRLSAGSYQETKRMLFLQ